MAGIYIHIPFCFSKCSYCDFYSIVGYTKHDKFFDCLFKEIDLRKNEFKYNIDTIYFGGGTPSFVSIDFISQILNKIFNDFSISTNCEITLEANPDDLNSNFLKNLLLSGVNRLSIGVQSFIDEDLIFMDRRHNSKTIFNVLSNCDSLGFNNISIDFIYGLPWSSIDSFYYNLRQLEKINFTHLSAYHLSFEENTPFYNKMVKGEIVENSEDNSFEQYKLLCSFVSDLDMNHYEISNFARKGFESKHNSSYWQYKPYLGLGPGAHSYYNNCRFINVTDIYKYVSGDFNQIREVEFLDIDSKFNEYIMLSLRTYNGISLDYCKYNFGDYYNYLIKKIDKWNRSGHLIVDNRFVRCTQESWFISDSIIKDLFYG
ncbi:radical SAM family heme chaperone HemW [Marinilabiliaceae bacterium ANBcel2]|nr:radical SAM family heme chaperone HemW [Marinilabiliaceae bacterium ANBcel2]